jgi:hypothetical protein
LEGLGEALGKSDKKKQEQGPGGFQDKIKQAMAKLKESESKLKVCHSHIGLGFRFSFELRRTPTYRVQLGHPALARRQIRTQLKPYFNNLVSLVSVREERAKQSWLDS